MIDAWRADTRYTFGRAREGNHDGRLVVFPRPLERFQHDTPLFVDPEVTLRALKPRDFFVEIRYGNSDTVVIGRAEGCKKHSVKTSYRDTPDRGRVHRLESISIVQWHNLDGESGRVKFEWDAEGKNQTRTEISDRTPLKPLTFPVLIRSIACFTPFANTPMSRVVLAELNQECPLAAC